IFSLMAMYLLAGKEGHLVGGTIKNFAPLYLKTPLGWLAEHLTEDEATLFKQNGKTYLDRLVQSTRGNGAGIEGLPVNGFNPGVGDKVSELLSEKSVPFAGKTHLVAPDVVGGKKRRGVVLETRYGGNRSYNRTQAKNLAKEMFFRVEILHMVADEDVMDES